MPADRRFAVARASYTSHGRFAVRTARGIVVVALSVSGSLAAGIVPAAASASTAGAWGYVFSNHPVDAHSTPIRAWQRSSVGAVNKVTRLSTGSYVVHFFGLEGLGTNSGTVYVTTAQSFVHHCKIGSGWTQTATSVDVSVLCFTRDGSPQDAEFDAAYVDPGSSFPSHFGYVWADQPAASSYTPAPSYQFNSGGGTNTITRTAVGNYTVALPGIGLNRGTVKVTGFGNDSTDCQVGEWFRSSGTLQVTVGCQNSSGQPADAMFTMVWTNRSSLLAVSGSKFGYVWADQPNAAGAYTPNGNYQWNSSGAVNIVDHTGTGLYTIVMPNLAPNGVAGGNVQASAYGSSLETCNTDTADALGAPDLQVYVYCVDAGDQPINTYFTVQYFK
jgi:hypothetical protein